MNRDKNIVSRVKRSPLFSIESWHRYNRVSYRNKKQKQKYERSKTSRPPGRRAGRGRIHQGNTSHMVIFSHPWSNLNIDRPSLLGALRVLFFNAGSVRPCVRMLNFGKQIIFILSCAWYKLFGTRTGKRLARPDT